jgi:hypothetical protein
VDIRRTKMYLKKLLQRRKIKKLLKKAIEVSVVLSTAPTISVPDYIINLFSQQGMNKIMEKSFSSISHDPLVIDALTNVIRMRSASFTKDLRNLILEGNYIVYTDAKCGKCGSNLYKIKESPFCLTCYRDRQDNKE